MDERHEHFFRETQDLETFFDDFFDGIFILDEHCNILYANKAAIDLYKISGNIIGKNTYELFQQGYYTDSFSKEALKQQKIITREVHTKYGNITLITSRPVFLPRVGEWRIIVHIRDITEFINTKRALNETVKLSDTYRKKLEKHSLEEQLKTRLGFVTQCVTMRNILDIVEKAAETDATVLIQGESGVGKELLAKAVHLFSKRREEKFVAINCGAIPENLIESELFGYEKGAYTGATKSHPGLFEYADKGTLLLDEIGELPQMMQVKLLRAIQEREITHIGGNTPIRFDVRFIAATNRNLEDLVTLGTFRQDLFYRLNVIQITVPPLRERVSDILLLLDHFTEKYNSKYNFTKSFSREAIKAIAGYSWPGNVRELENFIERMLILSSQKIIHIDEFPKHMRDPIQLSQHSENLREIIQKTERQVLSEAIKRHSSIRKAALALGIDHSTMLRKLKRHHLDINNIQE